jgi:hypothetical protein
MDAKRRRRPFARRGGNGGERLLACHAQPQAAEHIHPTAPPVVDVVPVRRHLGLQHHRHAHRRYLTDVDPVETGRRDANHREGVVADREPAPDDRRVRSEARPPVVVAEDGDEPVAARLVVVGRDDASERGADAQNLEIAARHQLAQDALRLAAAVRHADVHRDRPAREQAGKDLRRRRGICDGLADPRQRRRAVDEIVAEVFVHRVREHVAARVAAVVVPCAVEEDELFGVFHRKAPQEHFVDEREDGGVGADTEGDRHERDAREQRRSGEPAEGVSKNANQSCHVIRRSAALQILNKSLLM